MKNNKKKVLKMLPRYISESEVACPCCGSIVYDQLFVDRIQIIRDALGIPFHYSSFYRCRDYNDSLANGSPRSQHLLGKACDIKMVGFNSHLAWNLVRLAMTFSLSVGIYSEHIHLDLRDGVPIIFYGSY